MTRVIRDLLKLGIVYPISNSVRALYFEQLYFFRHILDKGTEFEKNKSPSLKCMYDKFVKKRILYIAVS